jgi:allophanate hydrolase subunit 1
MLAAVVGVLQPMALAAMAVAARAAVQELRAAQIQVVVEVVLAQRALLLVEMAAQA